GAKNERIDLINGGDVDGCIGPGSQINQMERRTIAPTARPENNRHESAIRANRSDVPPEVERGIPRQICQGHGIDRSYPKLFRLVFQIGKQESWRMCEWSPRRAVGRGYSSWDGARWL